MLHTINRSYLCIGAFMYIVLLPWVDNYYLPIFIINALTLLIFTITFNSSYYTDYGIKRLVFISFSYGLIYIIIYNIISYTYTNNYFVFSDVDAFFYDKSARQMINMPFIESLKYYLKYNYYEDLGMILILRSIYSIVESNLFYNLFNLIIGLITIIIIYKFSIRVMGRNYAFYCSLSYGISSFTVWFYASGLKETTMILFVVLFYYSFLRYNDSKQYFYLLLMIFAGITMVLFRPVLVAFYVASILLGLSLKKLKFTKKIILSGIIILSLVLIYPLIEHAIIRFLRGGDFSSLMVSSMESGKVVGGIGLTYATNLLSQIIGPFPTFLTDGSFKSFFAPGLLFKMFLAVPFWMGVIYIFKKDYKVLYPIIWFIFFEMISLILILNGLELRKSIPHIPFIFITAFWFMNYQKKTNLMQNVYIKVLNIIYIAVIPILLFIWEFK